MQLQDDAVTCDVCGSDHDPERATDSASMNLCAACAWHETHVVRRVRDRVLRGAKHRRQKISAAA